MDAARTFVAHEQLIGLVRATFGPTRHLIRVTRLRGGSKKGVYRLTFDDAFTAILYVWNAAENYWPPAREGRSEYQADPFAEASGIELFAANYACFDAIGVRTPHVYALDRSRRHLPADVAVVEDVRGGSLAALLQRNAPEVEHSLVRLEAALQAMRQHRGRRVGKVALVNSGEVPPDGKDGKHRTCAQIVLERAVRDLTEAAARVERVAQAREQVEARLYELAGAVRVRDDYSLVHGELGPDHVLVDERGGPVLIDIEGAMFFDVEWEHAFLRLRFGPHYARLRASDLDDRRLRLYTLALHLSLVAGPLRLLDGDYPERAPMLRIVEFNTQRALAFVGEDKDGA